MKRDIGHFLDSRYTDTHLYTVKVYLRRPTPADVAKETHQSHKQTSQDNPSPPPPRKKAVKNQVGRLRK